MSDGEKETTPHWLERLEKKREIVRDYMTKLDDDRLFFISFLYMRGLNDTRVAKMAGVAIEELEVMKLRIAIGLRLAGIEVRN